MEGIFIIVTVIIGFLISLFLPWYVRQKSLEKERLKLIEKDLDISHLPEREAFSFKFPWLKVGRTIAGGAFGALVGLWFHEVGWGKNIIPIMLFLFGGLGMVLAHYLNQKD